MVNENTEIFFHLGLTKVASTYFQQTVFPRLEGVTYFPKHQFGRFRDPAVMQAEGKLLFSTEKDRRIVEAVDEIVRFWPEAKVILFVRRHDDWLLSRYKYRIRKLGRESFSAFFDPENDSGLWKREQLYLRPKIEAIEKMCKTPPLVLTHDLLKEDPGEFMRRFTTYMGTSVRPGIIRRGPVHTAFSEKQLIVLRCWNRFHRYQAREGGGSLTRKIHRKYFEFALHTVAFIAQFIPRRMIRESSLLTPADRQALLKVKTLYAADWEFCREHYGSRFRGEG